MEVLKRLLQSRKFWLAVVAAAQTIVFQFFPDFPKEVWMSINAVIGVVIASIAYEDAHATSNIVLQPTVEDGSDG